MKRILIIEDDTEMVSLLKDFFTEEGYDTDSAGDGTGAFRKLMGGSFDLVIMDIKMPPPSGLEVLPGIKRLYPDVPVIIITAFGGKDIQRKAIERGAAHYLEKPVPFHELRTLLHRVMHP